MKNAANGSRLACLFRRDIGVAVVMLLARLFGMAFAKIGQPRVMGEVLAGIVLGPTVVGTMPASTWPITRGCPIFANAIPNSRASSVATATAMKNAAKRLPASRCFSAVILASPTCIVIVRSAALPSTCSVEPSGQWAWPLSRPSA